MREKPSDAHAVKVRMHNSPLKIFLLLAAIFVICMLVYFPDYARLTALKQANRKLKEDIQTLEKEIAGLKRQIKTAGSDPLVYEKVAREELGAVKENEIAVDIEE
jgi:cell division protein FtsB